MSSKPYDILIGEDYMRGGEEKTKWHRVGVCFDDENGGMSGEIPNGISISGRFLIRERKAKEVDGGGF